MNTLFHTERSIFLGFRKLVFLILAFSSAVFAGEEPLHFGRDIQPILSDRCYNCHGPDAGTREADLRLDQRDSAIANRDNGSAIVPGDPESSTLIYHIFAEDLDELMPPPKFKKPLNEKQKKLLFRWIKEGAEYTEHWSFLPIKEQSLPHVSNADWPNNSIDHFILSRLEKDKITPSPKADRASFLRRVSLDLAGLPPTIEELDNFLADTSPDAHSKVVDRLLSSNDFAERMATIWLDNARYADSNSYQFDNARTMWPWRDWVINAYRNNMPYDQFVTEQLAGDLLENPTKQQLIATGFNRNHGYSIEGGIIDEEYRVTYANDKTTTAGTLFLGLTLDCTRCHDHKYDPLTMEDYYSFYAFFNTSAEVGAPGDKGFNQKASAPFLQYTEGGGADNKTPLVMIMAEKPRETFILENGQFDQPGKKVVPRTPEILPPFDDYPQNRLGLSQWLIAPENPLFARVTVNRIWQQFFGKGLVKTADNFGLQGEAPTHPDLLDWLANDFRDNGWDIRQLIRKIVLSSTYRQNSRHRLNLDDPDNILLARAPSFRLPAETIRDQALAVSGLLSRKIGGPSVMPYQPTGIWEDLNAPRSHAEIYKPASGPDLYRKSLYTYWRRAAMHPSLAVFDAPNREVCTVVRPTTNTPLQALALLHDPTFIESARKLAEHILSQDLSSPKNNISLALRSTVSREPTNKEIEILFRTYQERFAQYQKEPSSANKLLSVGESSFDSSLNRAELAALADVCVVILNLSETVTRK
ncbi:MAG: PSD1 and planctomycete cytochrome C domain-containing protein [Akkermansiaceae bacterium]